MFSWWYFPEILHEHPEYVYLIYLKIGSLCNSYFLHSKPSPRFTATTPVYVRSALGSSTSSVKHHSDTHIIKHTVMKQSKGLNGDLKPYHKKTTNRTTMDPTTDIVLRRRPSKTDWERSHHLVWGPHEDRCTHVLEAFMYESGHSMSYTTACATSED